jgi:hypothetical protein
MQRQSRQASLPDAHRQRHRVQVVVADVAVEALGGLVVAAVVLAPFPVLRLFRVLPPAAPRLLVLVVLAADVRPARSPQDRVVLGVVDALAAERLVPRVVDAVEGAAPRRSRRAVSATGPVTRRILRWSSS